MGIKDISTEEKILEAAKKVFMTYGLYGARMQDIADKADINKALLHYYFRNKEKLFDAVFDGALTKYFDQMLVISDTMLSIEERLYAYVDRMFDFYIEYPQMSLFIIKEISIHPELFMEKVKTIKKGKTVLLPLLTEAMDRNEITRFNPSIFLVNLHSLCAYPFIVSPIFSAMFKKNGHTWEDSSIQEIKQSVKDFIHHKLN